MPRQFIVGVPLLAAMALAGSALAQERPGAVYASARLDVPWSQGLTQEGHQTYVLPPGGFSLGWSATGGVFVASHASVEFEVSRTGIVKRTEPSRYDTTWFVERRDTFFTTAARLHVRPRQTVDIEPVLGFDVVKEETWTATDRTSIPGGPVTHSPRYRLVLGAVAGFAAGADVRFGSGHVSVIASFRLHRTFWGQESDFGDTQEWTIVPGAGVRLVF